MKKIFILILTTLLLFSCASTPNNSNKPANSNETYSVKAEKPQYKGDGVRIAISAPSFGDTSKEKNWIPFYVQDSLTRNFAHYTKMTVLDRTNESVIKAELLLSESGEYSDENAVQYGQLTNAQYLVVGNIMKLQSSYDFSFRINDIETNEIRSTASGRYSTIEIENGLAINEITKQLLEGLGIGLSQKEIAELEKINSQTGFSSQNLARGMAAERNGNYVEALDFYFKTNGDTQAIAQQNVQLLLNGTIPTDSIKEKAAFYKKQQEKWKIIFNELEQYLEKELPIFVYDFSSVQNSINSDLKTARINIEPGVKLVYRRSAVIVWKQIMDAWEQIKTNKENNSWSSGLTGTAMKFYDLKYPFFIKTALFNSDGSKLETPGNGNIKRTLILKYNTNFNVKSQKKYFEDSAFANVSFSRIRIDDMEGDIVPMIRSIEKYYGGGAANKPVINPCIMNMDEWQVFINSL